MTYGFQRKEVQITLTPNRMTIKPGKGSTNLLPTGVQFGWLEKMIFAVLHHLKINYFWNAGDADFCKFAIIIELTCLRAACCKYFENFLTCLRPEFFVSALSIHRNSSLWSDKNSHRHGLYSLKVAYKQQQSLLGVWLWFFAEHIPGQHVFENLAVCFSNENLRSSL